jgi:dTDP-4-dehydrorhamnose reductase
MMRTLILGGGFLGQRFARDLPGARLSTVDITDRAAVVATLREAGAEVVVNAAGKTGRPNVDWCESHQRETYRANVGGAMTVADACGEVGAFLIHLGSGCVFYGPSPSPGGWRETDPANPVSYYSRTKYAADLALGDLPHVAVARLRMPLDGAPGPRNLITKLAAYAQVVDVENSVTVVDDLVVAIAGLSKARASGIFHVVNPGIMRHRDLVERYRSLVDPSYAPELIDEAALLSRGLIARQRSTCILADRRLAELGIHLRPIDVALEDAMRSYARALASSG